MDQGQGDHPLHQVLSEGFPEVPFIGRVIEPVVGQLKGNAHVQAEAIQFFRLQGRDAAHQAPHLARGCQQGSGLVFDNPQILRFGQQRLPVGAQLKNFSFRQTLAGQGHGVIHVVVLERGDVMHGPRVEVVSGQDAGPVPPHASSRGPPPAKRRFIQHVVMEQGRRMDEFDEAAEHQVVLGDIAREPGTETQQEGANAFAAPVENVGGDFVDERSFGIEVPANVRFDFFDVRAIQLPDFVHRQGTLNDWLRPAHFSDPMGGSGDCQDS